MPSYASRQSAEAKGRVTSTGATVPVPHLTTEVALTCVWPWNSAAVPVTRDHVAER